MTLLEGGFSSVGALKVGKTGGHRIEVGVDTAGAAGFLVAMIPPDDLVAGYAKVLLWVA